MNLRRMVEPDIIECMKNWITYIDRLRPHTHRKAEAGLRRRTEHESATTAPEYHEPYDVRMGDRFYADLSAR